MRKIAYTPLITHIPSHKNTKKFNFYSIDFCSFKIVLGMVFLLQKSITVCLSRTNADKLEQSKIWTFCGKINILIVLLKKVKKFAKIKTKSHKWWKLFIVTESIVALKTTYPHQIRASELFSGESKLGFASISVCTHTVHLWEVARNGSQIIENWVLTLIFGDMALKAWLLGDHAE